MKINYVSTLALNNSLRASTLQKQSDLVDLQKEISTGKKADIGRDLGSFTSSAVSLDTEIASIDQLKVTNSFIENKLKTMQHGINTLVDNGDSFITQMTAELSATVDRDILQTLGDTTYGTLQSTLNTTLKGEFVFSGVNTDSKALVDYNGADGAPAKAAVQAAFTANFGFATNDPLVETITPAALEAFIDGPYADLFNDANWGTLWSGGSEFGARTKVSPRELVENPTTSNAQAFRDATAATVLVSELANTQLNDAAMDKLSTITIDKMAVAITGLGEQQSKMGLVEEQVKVATERMDFQKNILQNQLSGLVDIDPYEAATRLTNLTTSLEASYAVTARIQSLSLLNFI